MPRPLRRRAGGMKPAMHALVRRLRPGPSAEDVVSPPLGSSKGRSDGSAQSARVEAILTEQRPKPQFELTAFSALILAQRGQHQLASVARTSEPCLDPLAVRARRSGHLSGLAGRQRPRGAAPSVLQAQKPYQRADHFNGADQVGVAANARPGCLT